MPNTVNFVNRFLVHDSISILTTHLHWNLIIIISWCDTRLQSQNGIQMPIWLDKYFLLRKDFYLCFKTQKLCVASNSWFYLVYSIYLNEGEMQQKDKSVDLQNMLHVISTFQMNNVDSYFSECFEKLHFWMQNLMCWKWYIATSWYYWRFNSC